MKPVAAFFTIFGHRQAISLKHMDKLWVIIKREYLSRVKSKGFIVGTILTPLIILSAFMLPAFLTGKMSRADRQITVLDQSGDTSIYERAQELLVADNDRLDRFQIYREAVNHSQLEPRQQELNRLIYEGSLDVYLVIPASIIDEGKITYHAKNIGDFLRETRVENAFNTAIVEQRMKRSGINVEQLNQLSRKIVMEKFNERGEGQGTGRIILAFALIGILCITIMSYGSHLMSAVIEEKESRIMEVLISSVKPFTLMMGKLIGVGMVGLTQYSVWSISGILLSSIAAMQSSMFGSFALPHISVSLMIFFVVYFLLGYFLYATLYAMVGGVVSNDEDGQQMQLPLMALILLAPLAASFVWRMPESALATAISMFPFFSPFGMFLRIAIEQPPWWQIALSILLLVAAILGAVWLTARFYRIGVLMYGKRPTITEMGKWLRYS